MAIKQKKTVYDSAKIQRIKKDLAEISKKFRKDNIERLAAQETLCDEELIKLFKSRADAVKQIAEKEKELEKLKRRVKVDDMIEAILETCFPTDTPNRKFRTDIRRSKTWQGRLVDIANQQIKNSKTSDDVKADLTKEELLSRARSDILQFLSSETPKTFKNTKNEDVQVFTSKQICDALKRRCGKSFSMRQLVDEGVVSTTQLNLIRNGKTNKYDSSKVGRGVKTVMVIKNDMFDNDKVEGE